MRNGCILLPFSRIYTRVVVCAASRYDICPVYTYPRASIQRTYPKNVSFLPAIYSVALAVIAIVCEFFVGGFSVRRAIFSKDVQAKRGYLLCVEIFFLTEVYTGLVRISGLISVC